ncbi:MAG: S9 family peptidase [Burkholderiales bacterium]
MPKSPYPVPPVAPRRPHRSTIHGVQRTDEYHWLRNKNDPKVRAYLNAENAYTAALMKPSRPLQGRLYREMLSRIKETDTEVPYREGEWFYYSRTRKGRQYRIYCRRHGRLTAREEIILDLNLLAKGRAYLGLGALDVSPHAGLLAYSTDHTGFREYTLYVKDLRSGRLLPERVPKARSVAWATDSRTLFYVTEDAAKRACRVWRRVLGDADSETLLYEETDERFSVSVDRSLSGGYIFITSASATASEVRYIPAADPLAQPRLFLPRRQEHEYYLDHGGDDFYVVTNDRGRNFRLVAVPSASPAEGNWRELIPHREDVMLDGVDVFARHLVVHERHGGFPALRVIRIADGEAHEIVLPESARAVYGSANAEFDSGAFRLYYESYVTPGTVYDYDMEGRRLTLLKQREVRGGYDSRKYRVELHYATVGDGTRIPVSLVYRKDRRRRGAQPLLLTGYGAYGFPLDTHFSSARLSLLDRGVIFAVAHVRGGGEMGKRWHDEGRMLNKRNTFTDFIACAEHLVSQAFTAPDRLAIEGGSAGGLLVGAAANKRPDLFRAAVAEVPFVDVVNTMLDASLPLTTGEYEEWGNPNQREYFDYMLSYSPYDNLQAQDYPAMLVETSLHDSQVMYWEPAKYVARLRALKTDPNPLLFRINMKAGHGGSSGRYDFLKEIAFNYAFILGVLGISR